MNLLMSQAWHLRHKMEWLQLHCLENLKNKVKECNPNTLHAKKTSSIRTWSWMSIRNPSSDHYQDYKHICISISTTKSDPSWSFSAQEQEDDDDTGKIYGAILSRRCEKQSSMFDNVLRKTMSMRHERQSLLLRDWKWG